MVEGSCLPGIFVLLAKFIYARFSKCAKYFYSNNWVALFSLV